MNGIASNVQKTRTPMKVTAASASHDRVVDLAVETGAIDEGGVASASDTRPGEGSATAVAGLDIERRSVLSLAARRHRCT
jgi:hypothetical protein